MEGGLWVEMECELRKVAKNIHDVEAFHDEEARKHLKSSVNPLKLNKSLKDHQN